jgi:DNA-binding MarR family transcriptional regulator
MRKRILDLNRYIPALLTFTSNKLSHGAAAKYRSLFDVNMAEWRILAMLALEPNISANRICQVIGLDKALVSRVLQKLVSRGAVVTKPDERNNSRYVISLTRAGEQLYDQVLEVVREREKILLSAFTKDEVETFLDLLHRLLKQADLVNAYDPTARKKLKTSSRKKA